jgi:hypothetical protein
MELCTQMQIGFRHFLAVHNSFASVPPFVLLPSHRRRQSPLCCGSDTLTGGLSAPVSTTRLLQHPELWRFVDEGARERN